jgi:hypothetical protein
MISTFCISVSLRLDSNGVSESFLFTDQLCPEKTAFPGRLQNKRLALRYDRLGFIIQSLLQAACIFLVAGRLANEL